MKALKLMKTTNQCKEEAGALFKEQKLDEAILKFD